MFSTPITNMLKKPMHKYYSLEENKKDERKKKVKEMNKAYKWHRTHSGRKHNQRNIIKENSERSIHNRELKKQHNQLKTNSQRQEKAE